MVAEENASARAFYERQGFVFSAKVIGNEYYSEGDGHRARPGAAAL
jgi:hypothetical protein